MSNPSKALIVPYQYIEDEGGGYASLYRFPEKFDFQYYMKIDRI